MPSQNSVNQKKYIPIIIGGMLVIAGAGAWILVSNTSTNVDTNVQVISTPSPTTKSTNIVTTTLASPTLAITLKYKDGTYTAIGTYQSPAGQDVMKVSINILSNKIVSVTVTPQSKDRESRMYQQDFATSISGIVVGKDMDTNFNVSKVSGGSLTGIGFIQALENIKNQAKN